MLLWQLALVSSHKLLLISLPWKAIYNIQMQKKKNGFELCFIQQLHLKSS